MAAALSLDGTGRLIDVGCGPGIVALTPADCVAEVVGIGVDAGLLAEAGHRADAAGAADVRWVLARAEYSPPVTNVFI